MNQDQIQFMNAQKNQLFNIKDGFFQRNQTQLILVFIVLLPSLIAIISTFFSLLYLQQESIKMIQQYSDQLYQDSINNSKLHNRAVLFQINKQLQKIPWQHNLINEFQGLQLQGKVNNSKKFIPALHNSDRTYINQENPTVLKIFKKNPIHTSVWHQVSKAYLSQLDEVELHDLKILTRVDFIWRSIMYNNARQTSRWIAISNTITYLAYDGISYQSGTNKTYSNYTPSDDCPYKGPYYFDPRCRYYFQPTVSNISTMVFPPTYNLGANGPYYASVFCQRRVNLESNNLNDIFGILCITLNLQVIPTYFQNFGNNSKFQMLIDPQSLIVLYNSQTKSQEQITVMQAETDNLIDQSQAKIFIGNITQNSNYVLQNMSTYQQIKFDKNQKTFEYTRNGTECFVLVNIITIVDQVPRIEKIRQNNFDTKFQLKNVYLFLNVLTKENLQIYSNDLQNTVLHYNKIFAYISYGLIIVLLITQIFYSIILGKYILNPIIHLTHILSKIRIQNSNDIQNSQSNKNSKSLNKLPNNSQNCLSESMTEQQQILIEEEIDADFEGVCYSKDTQELLNSFQDMFKVLRFTTQNFYKEDASLQLLNLVKQIQHFKRFGNNRALGVCYNNMGVIHYNCDRFQEALENFQKAIVYANYELNTYSHLEEGVMFSNSLKRLTVYLRNTIQNHNISLESIDEVTSNMINSAFQEKQKQKSTFNHLWNHQIELNWSLFNRKTNFMKALSMFAISSGNQLWDILEEQALENIIISQIYLPPSYKREIINYYILCKSLQQQDLDTEAFQVLKKLTQNYIKIKENKYGKIYLENTIQFQESTAQSINTRQQKREQYLENTINSNKFAQMSQTNDINHSFILFSPIKIAKKRNEKINISDQVKNKIYCLIKNESRKIQQKVSIASEKTTKTCKTDQQINQEEQEQKINLFKQKNNSLFSDLKSKANEYIQSKKNKKQSLYESNKFQFGFEQFSQNQSVSNSKSNLSPLPLLKEEKDKNQDKSVKRLSQHHKQKTTDQYHEFLHFFQKNRFSMRKSSFLESQKITNQKINKEQKLFPKKKEKIHYKEDKNEFVFFPVRKHKDPDQVAKYEYSSDIFYQYCSVEQASCQLKLKNFYNAAMILTNFLEQCEYYLPHLKKIQINILLNIFKSQKIKSIDLEETAKKYNEMTDYNFDICIISVCQKSSNKLKLYALCNDLVNEILFKENDSFGMIQYDFEEQIFMQMMAKTQIKLIKQTPLLFQQILFSLLQKKQKNYFYAQIKDNFEQEKNKTGNESFNCIAQSNWNNFFENQNINSISNTQINLKSFSALKQESFSSAKKLYANKVENFQNIKEKKQNDDNEHVSQFEQIQFMQESSQSSFESCSQPNQINNFKNISQNNQNKISNKNYVQTLSNLNNNLRKNPKLQNQQDSYQNTTHVPIKDENNQQMYTFTDDQHQKNSMNQNNTIKEVQNNLSNKKDQVFKNDDDNNQDEIILGNKEKFTLSIEDLVKKKYEEEENLLKIKNSDLQSPSTQSQFKFDFQSKSDQDVIQQKPTDSILKQSQSNSKNKQRKTNQNFNIKSNNKPFLDVNFNNKQLKRHSTHYQSTQSYNYFSDLKTLSDINQLDNTNYEANIFQKCNQKNKSSCKSSEFLFHQGIHACLKQFILNSDEKLSIYLAKNSFQNKTNRQLNSQKNQQKYLIYITDLYFQITNQNLIEELTKLLIKLDSKLLVLLQNDAMLLDETSPLQNVSVQGKQIISFFNTEQKMLQHIYCNREHLKNYLIPMVIEHF